MQVEVNQASFPYPTQFLLSSSATGEATSPVQPVGVLIAKQTLLADGSISQEQEEILMTDIEYEKPEGESTEATLGIYLESDLIPIKPTLDIITVRDSNQPSRFGTVRIKRQQDSDFGEAMELNYGWRSRLEPPRSKQAGDIVNFKPNPEQPFTLPVGFNNQFFNGGYLDNLPHLQTGDLVEYQYQEDTNSDRHQSFSVTISASPNLTITNGDSPIDPPVLINLSVDTVVYNFVSQNIENSGKFLIVWRGVFNWEERLANLPNATLEVS